MHLDPSIRNSLKEKVETVGRNPMFGLNDILLNTFVLQVDQKTQMTATDMAYSISALLESPKPLKFSRLAEMNLM